MNFDEGKLIIRKATLKDVDFIATTIVEAEKSGTDKCGTAKYFGISEGEYKNYLIEMLEEEIDGCEISISSFVVAEYEGDVVAARGGWLEGDNEDGLQSAILKANLFGYVLPKEVVLEGAAKYDIVKDIQIDRELGAYQLENSYTVDGFRGYHIMGKLDSYHLDLAKIKKVKKVQAHVFLNNTSSIRACEKSGFVFVKKYVSSHPETKNYYPDDTMVLMESNLQ